MKLAKGARKHLWAEISLTSIDWEKEIRLNKRNQYWGFDFLNGTSVLGKPIKRDGQILHLADGRVVDLDQVTKAVFYIA